jgi:hypothetical protein
LALLKAELILVMASRMMSSAVCLCLSSRSDPHGFVSSTDPYPDPDWLSFSLSAFLLHCLAPINLIVPFSVLCCSSNELGVCSHNGYSITGGSRLVQGSKVMFETDLDASPRTLRAFVNDKELSIFVTDIPESIHFAVCAYSVLRYRCHLSASPMLSRLDMQLTRLRSSIQTSACELPSARWRSVLVVTLPSPTHDPSRGMML